MKPVDLNCFVFNRVQAHLWELLIFVASGGFDSYKFDYSSAQKRVSEKTAAKWVRRYQQFGSTGLEDLSSKPHRSPRQTPSTLLEKVFELRRLRRNGWQSAHELKLSRATVSRILRRAGLNRLRSLDPPPPVKRYEHKRLGDLVHFDIKRLARIRKPGHRVTGDRGSESRGSRLGVSARGCR